MKKTKKDRYPNGHTAKTKYGSGDFTGQAIRQKVGKIILTYPADEMSAIKSKKPPRTLA